MEFHEVANMFPMMSKEEFDGLCLDIGKNGLIEPIWTYQGKIIDGRNRYKACQHVGIKPEYREWSGKGSLIGFVASLNIHRRHLSASQLAVIAATKALPQLEEENKQGRPEKGGNITTILDSKKNRDIAGEIFGVSPKYVSEAKKISNDAPDLAEKVMSGQLTIPKAKKELRSREIATQRAEIAQASKDVEPSKLWNVYHADMQTWQASKQYDFIITDPPYLKEYRHLYGALASRANEWLKYGGLLIAMAGQSYLDELYAMMSEHLDYYWTAAYLTPGQPTPLRQRNVNTTWKPLLIYSKGEYKGKIFGDVFKSDANDKDFHKWGQSISGMSDIITKICLSGQSILDPFCGAGTTGIAAVRHGCFFDGVELDIENVNISKGRINDA